MQSTQTYTLPMKNKTQAKSKRNYGHNLYKQKTHNFLRNILHFGDLTETRAIKKLGVDNKKSCYALKEAGPNQIHQEGYEMLLKPIPIS